MNADRLLKRVCCVAVLAFLMPATSAYAGAYTLLAPRHFERQSGAPVTETVNVATRDTASVYTINVYNGGLNDNETIGEYVSSSVITLNGAELFGPSEFNQNVRFLTKTIALQSVNKLTVQLRGKPGGVITLEILGTDSVPPTIVARVEPGANAAGWHNSIVEVSFVCEDAASGIALCPEPAMVEGEGANRVISGTAVDIAGNQAVVSVTLNIDKTPPIVNLLPDPAANAQGWHRTDVTVEVDCQDALSGVADCSAPLGLIVEGASQIASGTGRDLAGNTGNAYLTINIDKTPPSITTQFSSQPNPAGWFKQAVTLSFVCADALSGIQTCPPPYTVAADGEAQLISVTAVDQAGNTAGEIRTVNLDATAPTLDIAAPAPGEELRNLRPAIQLNVADNLALNASSLTVTVNGQPFPGACVIDAGTAICTPDSDLPRGDVTVHATVRDRAGNMTSAQVAFRIQDDRDGDGVTDEDDVFPDDPAHAVHPPVNNLSVLQQGQALQLSWQPPDVAEHLAGYNVYRADYGSDNFVKLNGSPLSAAAYNDAAVVNDKAYRYRVIAVADKKAIEGKPAEVNAYIAYNTLVTANVTAAREGFSGRINWQSGGNIRYRVYRNDGNGVFDLLADVDDSTYLNSTALWNKEYQYRVNTLLNFVNPVNGQAVTAEGPPGQAVLLAAVPLLTLTLDNAVADANGVFEINLRSNGIASVTGSYQNAAGPVSIKAQTGTQQLNTTATGGRFSLAVPASAGATWTLTLSEVATPPRSATLSFRFAADTTPPVLTLETGANISVSGDTVEITGTAVDAHSGIAAVRIATDRFGGLTFGALLGEGGEFSAEVPVDTGVNELLVTATDHMGNTASAAIQVSRDIPIAPQVQITSPANGSIVSQNKVNVTGVIYSSLPPAQLKVTLGAVEFFPGTPAQPGVHPFSFNAVPLTLGTNFLTVKAESSAASDTETVAVLYQQQEPEEQTPPVIDIFSPVLNTVTSKDSIIVSGTASAATGIESVTVNGQSVTLNRVNNSFVSFDRQMNLPADGNVGIVIVATAENGLSATRQILVTRDTQAPQITLNNALLPPPAVNNIRQLPYAFSGRISDRTLAGAVLNGNSIGLMPGAVNDEYVFDLQLNLVEGQQQTLTVEAWDRAGQRSAIELLLLADPPVQIEIISPADGAELIAEGLTTSVPVTLRTSGHTPDHEIRLRIDNGPVSTATVNNGLVNTSLQIPAASTEHTLYVDVFETSAAQIVASSQRKFSIINSADIALELTRSEPANGQTGQEPNTPIELYFNRPIDPTLLTVEVRETVHGLVYDTPLREGNSHAFKQPPELIEVNRAQAEIDGGLSVLPDNRAVVFYAEQDYGYSGTVYVDVKYDGAELGRFSFQVRPLPTFVRGILVDALGQKLAGISVSIPELERSTVSDSSGAYGFGFGDTAERAMPGGFYKLVVNPGLRNAGYGSVIKNIQVDEGRLNTVSSIFVPALNPDLPFRRIGSGQTEVQLADGQLKLDLSNVKLHFTEGPYAGRDRGDVHVQFTQANELNVAAHSAAGTSWVFAMQPPGIELSNGSPGIAMEIPPLHGSTDYAPPNGALVVMIGYDAGSDRLVPVGAGEIDNGYVKSVGALQLTRFDYIGYAFTNADGQAVLADFRDKKIGYERFISALNNIIDASQAAP